MATIIQVTLVSRKGYKPMSTLIAVEDVNDFLENKFDYQQKAATRICAQRHMTAHDLTKYGYDGIKCRVYDREKIARENAERYAKIKAEKGWT